MAHTAGSRLGPILPLRNGGISKKCMYSLNVSYHQQIISLEMLSITTVNGDHKSKLKSSTANEKIY